MTPAYLGAAFLLAVGASAFFSLIDRGALAGFFSLAASAVLVLTVVLAFMRFLA